MEILDEEILKECGCENCKDNNICNGVDLMNCYAKKRLMLKNKED